MKKKVLLAVAAAMAITSVSFALPLNNYEKGSVAIDLNTSISPDMKIDGYSVDAKNRLGAGVTYGIGNNVALQYKYLDNKTKDYYYYYGPEDYDRHNFQLTGHEFNVLYQINPNVSAFVGYARSTAKYNLVENYGPGDRNSYFDKQSKSGYQFGVIGQTKIADDVTGWASVSAGNRVTSYEIGLGYDVAKNTELNLFYRHTKYKDFNLKYIGDTDFTVKGLGAGVTVKF